MRTCSNSVNFPLSPRGRGGWGVRVISLRLCVSAVIFFVSVVASAQQPDRSAPPQVGPPPSFAMAPVQQFTLSNGLQVVLLEKHQVPLVQIDLVVKAGGVDNAPAKTGLASMVALMLTDGSGSRGALAFADAVDYLGADLHGSAGLHTSSVDLNTPLSKLDSALALMADAALRPAFPQAELDRHKKERLTALLSWRDEARNQVSVLFPRILYGTEHPYGRTSIGDEKTIRALTVDDLKQYHGTYYRPNNAFLVVVGDVTAASMRPRLEAAFGGWQKGEIPQPSLPAIVQVKNRNIMLVDKPAAAQTEIRIGCIGVPRLNDDFYPLVVMNTILGGSFSSRLNQNLRETHGYTYGAGSMFDFRKLSGPFTAYAAVLTAKTDSSLMEFMKELNGIRQPIAQGDVDRAKNYVALGFPSDFQTVGDIAGHIEEMMIYGLPQEYFNNYIRNVLAVTKADVERVAKKYLDPERMAIVMVGDRKEIEAKVKALKLGPLTNLTVDDVLGKAPKE
jgi:zinc protease